MIFNTWQRYFITQFLLVFFLFLCCFYGLYALIDYANDSNAFNFSFSSHWYTVLVHYFYVFSTRAEILIPIAIVISFVNTVCTLNTRQELVALMAGGISIKKLLAPFIYMGLFGVAILYLNEQFILPQAIRKLRHIEDSRKLQKKKNLKTISANHLFLEDKSLLIYQKYDDDQFRFFDVYWFPSIDLVYKIKYLNPHAHPPKGQWVDVLKRQRTGELIQESAFTELDFPSMLFNKNLFYSAIMDSEVLSLSDLTRQAFNLDLQVDEKKSRVLTVFYWRLLAPWLCLLIIIAVAPYCIVYSRHFSPYFVYVGGLFGLLAFYMIVDALQVMAKRQVVDPFWSMWIPFAFTGCYCGWRYSKI